MLQFVRRCADHFLTSEQQEVRLEAVRTCSRLLRLALHGTTSRHSETVTTTVADVLGKLLVVGITDTGENFAFLYATAALLNSFSPLISEYFIHISSRRSIYCGVSHGYNLLCYLVRFAMICHMVTFCRVTE